MAGFSKKIRKLSALVLTAVMAFASPLSVLASEEISFSEDFADFVPADEMEAAVAVESEIVATPSIGKTEAFPFEGGLLGAYDYTGFNKKVDEIRQSYPEGTPWTNKNNYIGDWWGCKAFANMMADAIFLDYYPQKTWQNSSIANIVPGDYISTDTWNSAGNCWNYKHTMFVIAVNGDYLTIAEGNHGGSDGWNGGYVHWGRTINKWQSGITIVKHAYNYDERINYWNEYYREREKKYLDLNWTLDGSNVVSSEAFATADVYVNGIKVADDCTDFYQSYSNGSSYEIRDIRVKKGYIYNGYSAGSDTRNGNLNTNRTVTLNFSTIADIGDDFYAYLVSQGGNYVKVVNNEVQLGKVLSTGNPSSKSAKQIWHFVKTTDGTYKIISEYDKKVLSAKETTVQNSLLITESSTDKNKQRWCAVSAGNGTYRMANAAFDQDGSLRVDLSNAGAAEGTALWLKGRSENATQNFRIIKLSAVGISYVKPSKPSVPELTVTKGSGSVTVKWDKVKKKNGFDTRKYSVYLYKGDKASGTAYKKKTALADTTTSCTFNDLPKGTYTVKVKAANTNYYSYYSSKTKTLTVSVDPVVTFSANGHGTSLKRSVKKGSIIKKPADLKSTGYIFGGWYKEKSCKTKWNFSTGKMGSSNMTLYAKWTPITYSVRFDANGGKGTMAKQTGFRYGVKKALSANQFTKKGYHFTGWNTCDDGTGKTYADKEEIVKLTSKNGKTYTLYAQWEKTKYKITYHLDGGTNHSSNPSGYYYYPNKSVSLKAPKKTGYSFVGWYSNSGKTKKITGIAGGSTGNKDVYAKWKANTYSVEFQANGGKGTMPKQTGFVYGTAKKLSANKFKKTGYRFVGWNTKKDGSGTTIVDQQAVKKLTSVNGKTVTLYAQWVNTSGRWEKVSQRTVRYASIPSGFDRTHPLYGQYNNSAVSAGETEGTKREVTTRQAGYIYWHWTWVKTPLSSGVYDVTISDRSGVENGRDYKYFMAFQSTEDCGHTSSNGKTFSDIYYWWNGDWNNGSFWWFRFPVYEQVVTEYQKVYG